MSGSTSDTAGETGTEARSTRTTTRRRSRAKPAIARDTIADAAEIMGGAAALAEWAQADDKNKEKFWTTLYPKLIPLQVTGEAGGPIRIAAAIEAARKRARAASAPTTNELPDAEEPA